MLGGQLGVCGNIEYHGSQSSVPAVVSTVDKRHTCLCLVCMEQGQLWYVGNFPNDSQHGCSRMDEDSLQLKKGRDHGHSNRL